MGSEDSERKTGSAIISPLMINKVVSSPEAALADVSDGATIMIGGFGTAGMPEALVDAVIAQGAGNLTVVCNNAGNGETGLAALLKTRRVRKILCCSPVRAIRTCSTRSTGPATSSSRLFRKGRWSSAFKLRHLKRKHHKQ